MEIRVDDLSGPEVAEFLQEHLRQMMAITPIESMHALDIDALRQPNVTFWTARDGTDLVGCAALKGLTEDHAEIKSMRTRPVRQRSGVGSRVLEHVLGEARRMGFGRLSLETGAGDFFLPARRLYEKYGFAYCEPFGEYRPDPLSVFMTRTL